MRDFFSFVHDGRKIYFFSADQRRNGVKMPDGNRVGNFDSHSSITCFYGLDDDGVNKFEYNPYTDKLVLDGKTVCVWDEPTIRQQLAGIDWFPLAGDVDGIRDFLATLKTIPWLQPDGSLHDGQDGIRLYKTRDAAQTAARSAAEAAARSAARSATRSAAWFAARFAVRPAARDAAWDAVLYARIMYTCAGLPIAREHIEHVRKRMDVWRHGYGVLCDVNGEMYCYERI